MKKINRDASADKRTVQKVARGEVKPPRKPRTRRPSRNGRVASLAPDPILWAAAMLMVDGDASRLCTIKDRDAVGGTSVLIANNADAAARLRRKFR